MMLVRMSGVSIGYGGPPLLDRVDFAITRAERVCLVGRNGAGKTTLLRLVAGEMEPDEGQIVRAQDLRLARLMQEAPPELQGSVFDVVAAGLGEARDLLIRHHRTSVRLAAGADSALLAELGRLQRALDASGGWHLQHRVEAVLERLRLAADSEFATLSGGLKRRVLLARALVSEPTLLLLDEPTNHLDIDAIAWLEEYLLGFPGALLFVTHDRAFVRRLATRIVEIDRGQLSDWPGDFECYLRRKQELLDAEARRQAAFDRKLAAEERWIRQGIKARRTRNEGRVRALERWRADGRPRRAGPDEARLRAGSTAMSGRLVIEARDVSYAIGERTIVRELTTTILRGDKVGIIGPNGCGKTTLLRLLLGELAPSTGRIRHGTQLEVGYCDQQRAVLDPEASVRDNVSPGSDTVHPGGRTRHIMSYLQDFLFSPARARTPVKALSGGERNRLLLARVFARPCNVLVLDEPTNDLDVETLELLEELLLEFAGTVLLVTHDRTLLDNVVGSTLAYEGDGRFREYVGGYQDWLRQRPAPKPSLPAGASAGGAAPRSRAGARRRKLGYNEQRELAALPELIEALEQEQGRIHARLADPALYRGSGEDVATAKARLAAIEQQLDDAYARWETLESLREQS